MIVNQPDTGLKKNLNLLSLTIFGVGIIIGAGVYAVLGVAAGEAGNSLWLSFFFAALVAVLTAFSYCELATLFPNAGAEYVYLQKVFPNHKFPSFLMGFVLILAGSVASATVAVGFGGYLENFFGLSKLFSAFILLALVTLVNCFGIHNSSKVNLIFTSIEVSGLLLVIWFGFYAGPIPPAALTISHGTFSAASLIFFVYLGFEDIANLAEETHDPNKNIPRAILWSLIITTILYLAVALAVMRLAPPELLFSSDSPLSDALKVVAPKWVNILSAIALFSTANTALITTLAISRMVYGIAKEGDLPKFLSKTQGAARTPLNAVLFTFIAAVLFLLIGNLEILANVSSFTALIGFLIVNLVTIVLRYLKPNLERPFRSPINLGRFPILAFLGVVTILVLCWQFDSEVYLIGASMFLLGALVFYIRKYFRWS